MFLDRCSLMAVLSDSADGLLVDPGASALQPSVVLALGRGPARARVAACLESAGLPIARNVDAASEIQDGGMDGDAVIVLACDVDAPTEMATLRRLRRLLRSAPILAISSPTTGTGVRRALEAGADAIVFEPELESTLAVAIFAVASGQSIVPRKLRASVERPVLSFRERQVLSWVSRGYTNAQIADELFLSESTIKSHLSTAFAKFGVRSRREAAALFLDLENGKRASA